MREIVSGYELWHVRRFDAPLLQVNKVQAADIWVREHVIIPSPCATESLHRIGDERARNQLLGARVETRRDLYPVAADELVSCELRLGVEPAPRLASNALCISHKGYEAVLQS